MRKYEQWTSADEKAYRERPMIEPQDLAAARRALSLDLDSYTSWLRWASEPPKNAAVDQGASFNARGLHCCITQAEMARELEETETWAILAVLNTDDEPPVLAACVRALRERYLAYLGGVVQSKAAEIAAARIRASRDPSGGLPVNPS